MRARSSRTVSAACERVCNIRGAQYASAQGGRVVAGSLRACDSLPDLGYDATTTSFARSCRLCWSSGSTAAGRDHSGYDVPSYTIVRMPFPGKFGVSPELAASAVQLVPNPTVTTPATRTWVNKRCSSTMFHGLFCQSPEVRKNLLSKVTLWMVCPKHPRFI